MKAYKLRAWTAQGVGYIGGDTFPFRHMLKCAGGKYDPERKAWAMNMETFDKVVKAYMIKPANFTEINPSSEGESDVKTRQSIRCSQL